jgi:hypothetical protein
VKLRYVNATELIGRIATNEYGSEYIITGIHYNLDADLTVYQLSEVDADGKAVPHTECGVESLKGFTVD